MDLTTKKQQYVTGAIFEVETGTTGLRGGDAGHGGRTFMRFRDVGDSHMRVEVQAKSVNLVFEGDAELDNLIDGLQFAADLLRQSREGGTTGDMPGVTGVRRVE